MAFCPKCGTQLAGNERFCVSCGNDVSGQAAPASAPVAAAPQVAYTPVSPPPVAAAPYAPPAAAPPATPYPPYYPAPGQIPMMAMPQEVPKHHGGVWWVIIIAAVIFGLWWIGTHDNPNPTPPPRARLRPASHLVRVQVFRATDRRTGSVCARATVWAPGRAARVTPSAAPGEVAGDGMPARSRARFHRRYNQTRPHEMLTFVSMHRFGLIGPVGSPGPESQGLPAMRRWIRP